MLTKQEAELKIIELFKKPEIAINTKAIVLQAFIDIYGPVSNENGEKIKELIG